MFNTILVTIDLNHPASWAKALPTAAALAKANNAALHAVSVAPDLGGPMVAGYFPAEFAENLMVKTKTELVQLLARELPGETVSAHVAIGHVHEEILKTIEATGADLVVMASHAPDRVREFLVGSQADRVVRRSPVSVLVTRG
jgi:nucleotide-binding universal stress UspA family protein